MNLHLNSQMQLAATYWMAQVWATFGKWKIVLFQTLNTMDNSNLKLASEKCN